MKPPDLFWGFIIFLVTIGVIYTALAMYRGPQEETYEVRAIFVRDNCVIYRLSSNKRDLFYYADCAK